MKANTTLQNIFLAGIFLTCGSAKSQIGALDPSFSGDGKFVHDIAADDEDAYGIAIQSDGKIILACDHFNGSDFDGLVVRLNSDGTLDNTFDSDGITNIDLAGEDMGAYHIALQGDGKIVVCGYDYSGGDGDFMAARLNTDGSLDNTFDTDGVATVDVAGIGQDEEGISLTIQLDGKILVVGYTYNGTDNDLSVVRFNTDGSLDNTFDSDGILIVDSGADDFGSTIAQQSDGQILVAGTLTITDGNFVVARLNDDGSTDATFGTGGMTITDFATDDDEGYFMSLQSDGKILLAGTSFNGSDGDFAIARYDTNGDLDLTFDTDGKVITDFAAGYDMAYSVVEQTDGKIVVVGSSGAVGSDFALARYNSDGSPDATFGSAGKVTTAMLGGDSECYRVALQTDGKIVAVGYVYNETGDHDNIAVARYLVTDNSGLQSFDSDLVAAHPNPFVDQTTIALAQAVSDATLSIRNVMGQELYVSKEINGNSVTVHRNNLPAGVYFLDLSQENIRICQIKLIVTD